MGNLGPFLNSDVSLMPKLIQIVLQTPMLPLHQGIVDADLVCSAMAAEYNLAFRIANNGLAYRITCIVTSRQRNTA
jgi:hypothetical protein